MKRKRSHSSPTTNTNPPATKKPRESYHQNAAESPIPSSPSSSIDMFDCPTEDDDDDDLLLNGNSPPQQQQNTATSTPPSTLPTNQQSGYLQYRISHIIKNRYKIKKLAGTGVFSNVLLAHDLTNDTTVALKIIRANKSMQRAGYNEINMLKTLHQNDPHNQYNCLRLLDHFEYKDHVCLVLPSYSTNLRNHLFEHGPLPLHTLRIFAYQILRALHLLKFCEIVHADLKPDNILINEEATEVVLGDLGTAFHLADTGISPLLQSRFYRAPEVILGFPHSPAVDMFSLGCVLYELCTGTILLESRDNNDHLKRIMELKGEVPRKMRRHNDAGLFAHEYFTEEGDFLEQHADPGDSSRIMTTPKRIKKKHTVFQLLEEARVEDASTSRVHQLRQLADLIERMLTIDPEKRTSVDEAFYHDFFGTTPM